MYIFEHPLTEKIRMYLRVESLLKGIYTAALEHETVHYHVLFRNTFDLLELLDQFQLKQDLTKDFEALRNQYQGWLNIPDINQDALQNALDKITHTITGLKSSPRFGEQLRNDKFLLNIRQRFYISKGLCSFDLPMVHHWLNSPLEKREQDLALWTQSLDTMKDSLDLYLYFMRNATPLKPITAKRGTYQSDCDDAQLLRLDIPMELNCYPMISGSRQRFNIKFMKFETGEAYLQDLDFKLAIC